jgi:hypothetical protein
MDIRTIKAALAVALAGIWWLIHVVHADILVCYIKLLQFPALTYLFVMPSKVMERRIWSKHLQLLCALIESRSHLGHSSTASPAGVAFLTPLTLLLGPQQAHPSWRRYAPPHSKECGLCTTPFAEVAPSTGNGTVMFASDKTMLGRKASLYLYV